MKKSSPRRKPEKLNLHRETLANLVSQDLEQVAGARPKLTNAWGSECACTDLC